ncbi:MAG: tripartite tricarboxylate transporter TctB family protein [Alphaproteobacteria bacterium]|nr:tripartite tricarboxylate transporter TctB family protein [Alphaproteobacteria bacterium]
MRWRGGTDVIVGALLIAVAAAGYWLAADLRIGTAMRMGPGYFPRLVCWVLAGFGLLLAARGLLAGGPPLETWAVRPLLLVSAAIAAFGLLLERLGLVVAVLALVALSRAGGREGRPVEAALLAIGLAVFCVSLFVWLLGMTPPVWPWRR